MLLSLDLPDGISGEDAEEILMHRLSKVDLGDWKIKRISFAENVSIALLELLPYIPPEKLATVARAARIDALKLWPDAYDRLMELGVETVGELAYLDPLELPFDKVVSMRIVQHGRDFLKMYSPFKPLGKSEIERVYQALDFIMTSSFLTMLATLNSSRAS